jgi:hypothetical protein
MLICSFLNNHDRKYSMVPNLPDFLSFLLQTASLLHKTNKVDMLENCQCNKDGTRPSFWNIFLGI